MTAIYLLSKDDKHPTLVQDEDGGPVTRENDFVVHASSQEMHGIKFPSTYAPVRLRVAAETAKRKGVSDVQTHFLPFIIFTERAMESLAEMLEGAGQPLNVDSRFPGLMGFHVTRVVEGALDFEKSDYAVYEKGPLVRKAVLFENKVRGIPIFKIRESSRRVFVSGAFKQRVEQRRLTGFSFLHEVQLTA
jgi:hypothetical protein